jgi:hypothetical protein
MRVEFLLGKRKGVFIFLIPLYTLGMIKRNFIVIIIIIIISFGRYFTLRNAPFFGGRYLMPKGFVSE